MRWHSIALLAAALPFTPFLTPPAAAQEPRISGPAIHENLSIYFIHGTSAPGPAPLTLKEAMTAGTATVHETGNVNSLTIENTGKEDVFVQAGDIVKGGQQDRVLTVSFLVPPGSGRIDIAAYCVEQGRWSARGGEDVKKFASSEKSLPSRDAKLAMLAPSKPAPEPAPAGLNAAGQAAIDTTANMRTRSINQQAAGSARADTGSRQTEMWSNVAKAQRKLTENLGAPVNAAASASSLQLALENTRLAEARKAYVTKLEGAARGQDDIVGYVFAIGGKVNSGDVYSSNALFQKMWTKQLEAAVTEAIGEKNATAGSAPVAALKAADISAFLTRAEGGRRAETKLPATSIVRETREADNALLTETRRSSGGVVHRSYIAF
jgi:hypothetical protein